MADIIALGELLIDFGCESGADAAYPSFKANPGGAPANFLAALSKLGARTALISNVGKDAFGDRLIATMTELGVDVRGIEQDEDAFTTLAFVSLGPEGEREFSFARKPGADTRIRWSRSMSKLLDEYSAFHFGSLSLTDEPARATTQRAVASMKKDGKLISFDANIRLPLWESPVEARYQVNWALGQADVVKLSDEEALFLFNMEPIPAAAHIIKTFGAKLVLISCGGEGCCYKSAQAQGFVPALSGVTAVDTTGAGDIFFGAAMYKILESGKAPDELSDEELRDIAAFANTAAGISVSRPGAIPSVPTMEEILAYL